MIGNKRPGVTGGHGLREDIFQAFDEIISIAVIL
jgi:hypothetical protein